MHEFFILCESKTDFTIGVQPARLQLDYDYGLKSFIRLLWLGLLLGYTVGHSAVLIKFYHVNGNNHTTGVHILHRRGSNSIVGVVKGRHNHNLVANVLINIKAIISNTRVLASGKRQVNNVRRHNWRPPIRRTRVGAQNRLERT